jgi:hypothetical protein
VQGRRRTVPFKMASFRVFFFVRKENVIGKNPKMGYDKYSTKLLKRKIFVGTK